MQIYNDDRNFEGRLWSTDTCLTTYNYDKKSISCSCTNINGSYYAIVTDLTRLLEIE